ncbi:MULTISPECIES: flagellar hook-associated protein FlgK [unclassified Microbacterium]|uniref:flagellar hook-associated protein FlgK n=1 Tax=unclassified Microbacterium TaxID=2609290 RepID=UPI000EA9BBD1|nr:MULTISPECIES: flagellar hook-associated protein FlgK [unclassified Microbacterium]MBT2485058.1 flagellar hook-associated protein FlgK [Microbacterium sp. ISL-108]RKN67905.1 flagellar hook-associated protein FlgK [Microbacterium sp. CGR2]
MSTFSGLNTAASGLAAARRGMDVVGQNIANQTTDGYTRQRVTTSSVAAIAQTGRFSAGALPGHGVSIDGVARLGDALLDARVRDTLGASGFWSTRAVAATAVEASLAEPTKNGLAARMTAFWAGWQDLANTPDSGAAASSVLESAKELASHIAGGYRMVANQWSDARAAADRTVTQVNAAADQIAVLNREIRDALASGRSANELMDQRGVLAQTVARLSGAGATIESDGTMTVRIDGNALVSGTDSRHLALSGPTSIDAGQRFTVSWESDPGLPVSIGAGELGGSLSVLAPAADGGLLAQVAAGYNSAATALADSLNTQHRAGVTSSGQPGGDFFAVSATGPAALGLTVAVDAASDLALAAPGAGAWDATNADLISEIGLRATSPDAVWSDQVTRLGVSTAADVQRAGVSESAAVAAARAQQSVAAVDGDEETISLLTYQTAYQAAARVMTAVDEALDVLINRTGLVGR